MREADRYRLEPLHTQCSREERARQDDLAAVAGDVRATQAGVEAAAARVEAARTAIARARMTAPAETAFSVTRIERYLGKLRRDLEAAIEAHLRADASHRGQLTAFDGAQARLVAARADRQVIERHFERWRIERRKLADRRED